MFANFKCIQYVVGKSTQYAHNVPVRGVTDDNNTSKNSTFVQEDIIQEKLERDRKNYGKNLHHLCFVHNINICAHIRQKVIDV